MAEVKQRNGMTDLLKFIFAVMIVCYHSKSFADRGGSFIFTQGYIAVDFFFITAGFHLAASAMRKRDAGGGYSLGRETAGYMGRRLSRILPLYLTAAVIALTAAAAIKGLSVKGVVKLAADSIGEWTFLQQTGFDTGILVGASWFLSALILLSLLLYPMVRKFGDTFLYVIAPLVFAFMFGLAFHHVPDIQAPRTMLGGMIMIGLARGLFEMCLGCLIFGLVRLFRGYDLKKAGKIILTVTEVLIYAGVIVYHSIGKHPKKYDWYTIIALGIAVLITCSGFSLSGKVIKGKVFTFLGEWSFAMYISHRSWSLLMDKWSLFKGWTYSEKLPVYLMISTASSLAVLFGGKLIARLFRLLKDKLVFRLPENDDEDKPAAGE